MIKTGFFGGSFNPIHKGHIELAKQFLRWCQLDEVWFMVSPQNPLKQQAGLAADDLRLKMVRAALRYCRHLKASNYEFHLPLPSYTWDTLQQLAVDEPQRTFTLLIGSDNWLNFKQWYCHEKILASHAIAIYPRSGAPVMPDTLPENVQLIDSKTHEVSSTDIRHRIRNGLPISEFVPKSVEHIIRQERLYQG